MTWTGKSAVKNQRKVSLKKFKTIIKLISQLCVSANRDYTEKLCEKDIIYTFLKYKSRAGVSTDSSPEASRPPSTDLENPIVEESGQSANSQLTYVNQSAVQNIPHMQYSRPPNYGHNFHQMAPHSYQMPQYANQSLSGSSFGQVFSQAMHGMDPHSDPNWNRCYSN